MQQMCFFPAYTSPVLIGNGKYILFVGKSYDGIVLYDVQNDTCPRSLRIPYPNNEDLYSTGIAFDSKKNLVYIWGGYNHPCFMILDLNTKKWDVKVTKSTAKEIQQKYNVRHVGWHSGMVCDAHHTLHVIGGANSNAHMIFNAKLQVFEERYVFKQFLNIIEFGLVYDPMNDRLIFFGGRSDDGNHLDSIWFFNISSNSWTECKDVKLKYGVAFFGFIFLDEIQIILIFGGHTNGDNIHQDIAKKDFVLLLDFNNNSCTEIPQVKCAMKSEFFAILAPKNEYQEDIHLFDYSRNHWCTSLESVLPAKYFNDYTSKKNIVLNLFFHCLCFGSSYLLLKLNQRN